MRWDELLLEIRTNLEDASETPKWSNQDLYVWTREAVADYSQFLPLVREEVALVQSETNPKMFALPADFLAELAVSCPDNNFLEPRRSRPGARVVPGRRPLFYRVDAQSLALYVDADPGTNPVAISYAAVHPLPANKDDLAFVFTIPTANMELIKLYVEGKVNAKIKNAQARLDRFKIGAGARTDNPMINEVEDFFATYREKLEQRIPSRSLTLYKPRRYK